MTDDTAFEQTSVLAAMVSKPSFHTAPVAPSVSNLPRPAPAVGAYRLNIVGHSNELSDFDPLCGARPENFCITGSAGSGKTLLVYDLIGIAANTDCAAYIVNGSGSYGPAAEWVDGSYYAPRFSEPMSFNPLWGIRADESGDRPARSHIAMVTELVFHMINGSINFNIEKIWCREFLASAITDLWYAKRDRIELKDLYDVCVEGFLVNDDARVLNLARALAPYAVDRYAAWFNGQPAQFETKSMRVMDIEKLHGWPELIHALGPTIIYRFIQHMFGQPPSMRKMLIVDDLHAIFGTVKSSVLVEMLLSALREQNASAGLIAMRFEDYNASSALHRAFKQAPWQLVFHQSRASTDFATNEEMIEISEQQRRQIAEFMRGPDFSELAIFYRGSEGFYRHFPDPRTRIAILPKKSDSGSAIAGSKQSGSN